ncbi:MAG TPA: class A beta-lactamase-related serine hydrolase [Gammaproteobacteria bacterium]|jgi:CubicO group peptidase (beta-lactamase class C family)|nr:class A beta-lactamase-related serine hydrolase [Gammaproteobacteria bacterium]HIL64384.1 class A beta-lactamase-related serine hydrolase [Porticoccaceae bacterium]|tara:strand:- start:4807 stop:6039 length:1233 start_codon:yes stop_codon:yes gene_type:complete
MKKILPCVVAALMLLISITVNAEPPINAIKMIHSTNFGIDRSELEVIKSRMQAAVDDDHIAGALLLVGSDQGVGVVETVGYQGPDDKTPVNQDTIFRIYSMTKPIVSVATMSMVEDGLIKLDDPVSKFIPEFAELKVIDETTGEISRSDTAMTVQHLLTQESGLIQEFFSPDSKLGKLYGANVSSVGNTALQLAQSLGKLPVYFEPGSKWHYGHSTDVLGVVIEVAAGKPLDELLRERIFDPLGMDDTSFYVPAAKAYRIAEPIHGEMGDNTMVRPMLSGGGGLNSSTENYVRFAQMLLNGGVYHGARIIEEDTLELMTRKYIGAEVSREFFFYGDRGDWGLGFHLQPTDGSNADGPHNFGWQGIGGTIFIVDPNKDFFMIYMEQKRGGPRGSQFNNNVAQQVIYSAMSE